MRIIILTLIFCLITSFAFAETTTLTINICEPNICIGGVLWESEPGPNINYKIIDELKTCFDINNLAENKRIIEIEKGWYGITVYDQKLNWIKDYRDINIQSPAEVEWCR